MSEFLLGVLSVTTGWAILASLVFGLIIGAFYGYTLAPGRETLYPWSLWLVVNASLLLLAGVALLDASSLRLDRSLGRMILWTFTCGAIPIGRYLRFRLHLAWAQRRRLRSEKEEQ